MADSDITAPELKGVVEELERLLERATPRPWDAPDEPLSDARHVFATGLDGHRYVLANCKASATFVTAATRETDQANAALIVAAVNALPALLSRLSEQEAQLAERERTIAAMQADHAENFSGKVVMSQEAFEEMQGEIERLTGALIAEQEDRAAEMRRLRLRGVLPP